jgi:hypothetical protein
MSLTVKINGMAELERKLGKLPAKKWARGALVASANDLVTWTAPYPPAPAYGVGRSWYERGYGSRWQRRDGSIGGRKTSEDANSAWKVEPKGDLAVLIRNNASYSGYLHDKDAQVGFHKARGWLTVQDMFEKHAKDIAKKIQDAIKDIWTG